MAQEAVKMVYPLGPPRPIVTEFAPGAPRGRALDLGAGVGRESFYLAAALGYKVDAVDNSRRPLDGSKNVLSGLERVAQERRLPIHVFREDFQAFNMGEERYQLILALYSFQQPQESEFPHLVWRARSALVPGGRIILGLLTRTMKVREGVTDADVRAAPLNFYPDTLGDVMQFFPDFLLRYGCDDGVVWDREGHPGTAYPHAHTILNLVADKPQ